MTSPRPSGVNVRDCGIVVVMCLCEVVVAYYGTVCGDCLVMRGSSAFNAWAAYRSVDLLRMCDLWRL